MKNNFQSRDSIEFLILNELIILLDKTVNKCYWRQNGNVLYCTFPSNRNAHRYFRSSCLLHLRIKMLISWIFCIFLKWLLLFDESVIFHFSLFFPLRFPKSYLSRLCCVFFASNFCHAFFFSWSEDGFSRMIIFHLSNWY